MIWGRIRIMSTAPPGAPCVLLTITGNDHDCPVDGEWWAKAKWMSRDTLLIRNGSLKGIPVCPWH